MVSTALSTADGLSFTSPTSALRPRLFFSERKLRVKPFEELDIMPNKVPL